MHPAGRSSGRTPRSRVLAVVGVGCGDQPELQVSETWRRRATSGRTRARPRVLRSGNGIELELNREAHIVRASLTSPEFGVGVA